MKKADFLIDLEDIFQRDDACNENDLLESYEEWDSLSKMSLVAYFDRKFNLKLTLKDFDETKIVSDLIKLAGEQIQ